ncbi:hypothetical protein IC235_10810 [Hymenobacter sp. BT664]|uniref:Uncharacterized protein n=1 Tax=Hymenobacter montanus TaxID=2771359 RepID=A0A927GJQ4_9BACT|nr:hypothetical protein [Hymenobacter montanus]MBD2768384.1 hypothetical protein [Hymenobacter montanus]
MKSGATAHRTAAVEARAAGASLAAPGAQPGLPQMVVMVRSTHANDPTRGQTEGPRGRNSQSK